MLDKSIHVLSLLLMANMLVLRRAVVTLLATCYTPGIYADGYIVFAFPFVRSYVRLFVRSLVRSLFRNVRGIYVKVFVKVSLVVYIS